MRRSPVRIYEARRSGLVNRLRGDGVGDEASEKWVRGWESAAEGLDPHTTAFWEAASRWINERRARGDVP